MSLQHVAEDVQNSLKVLQYYGSPMLFYQMVPLVASEVLMTTKWKKPYAGLESYFSVCFFTSKLFFSFSKTNITTLNASHTL